LLIEYNGNNFISSGVLYFYSSWSSECNISKDNLNKLLTKNINILKINTTKHYKIKLDYKIKTIPSFILINDKKEVSRIDGMINKIKFDKWILDNL
jgi:thioredoxin-like negative regulator of GroEL